MRRRNRGCARGGLSWSRLYSEAFSRLLERVDDVILVSGIFHPLFSQLGFFSGDQPSLVRVDAGRVPRQRSQARFENEAEEVIRVLHQDGVGLGLGEWQSAGDFADPS